MAQPPPEPGAGPMVIDEGVRGLDQSRHHPQYEQSQYSTNGNSSSEPVQPTENWITNTELDQLVAGLVIPGKEEEIRAQLWALLKRGREVWAPGNQNKENTDNHRPVARESRENEPITRAEIAELLKNAVHEAINALSKAPAAAVAAGPGGAARPSWAAVAAGPPGPRLAKEVPARQEREIIVRATELPAELANRTAKETITAIQTAAGREGPVAARRLRSGDTAITFLPGTREEFLQGREWVTKAFGEGATIAQRTYAVLAKGLPANSIRGVDLRTLATDLSKANRVPIIRCHVKGHEGSPRAALLIEAGTVEAAKTLCEQGTILDAELYHTEPYDSSLQPRRCYRCHGYGHVGRYCRATARCGHCAGSAHPGGDDDCPARKGEIPHRCVNCQGPHAAWNAGCPAYQEQRAKATAAYGERPLTYAARGEGPRPRAREPTAPTRRAGTTPSQTTTRAPGPEQGPDNEGFRTVTRKRTASSTQRGRGRPRIPLDDGRNAPITGFLERSQSRTSNRVPIIPSTQW
jgi:hypothetical protein